MFENLFILPEIFLNVCKNFWTIQKSFVCLRKVFERTERFSNVSSFWNEQKVEKENVADNNKLPYICQKRREREKKSPTML